MKLVQSQTVNGVAAHRHNGRESGARLFTPARLRGRCDELRREEGVHQCEPLQAIEMRP